MTLLVSHFFRADENSHDGSSPGAEQVQRFPWESQAAANETRRSSSPENGKKFSKHMDKLSSKQQTQNELEFLASMTFANGGLRAPSCPCCQ